MLTYFQKISLNGADDKHLTVRIGKDQLTYYSDNKDIIAERPSISAINQDYNSAEHLFRLAEDINAMRDYNQAMETYFSCLKLEPTHSRALYRIAELYYRKAEYSEGLKFAKQILENDTYDGSGNFISGMIFKRLGKLNQAEEAFSVAARTMEYRSAAYVEMAGLKIQKGDFQGAVEYAKKALDFNRYNIPAYELLSVSYRKLNKQSESERILNEVLDIDPLDHFARFEQYLINPTDEKLTSFKSLIRNELPYETYLELAVEYANIGLDGEAIKVLEQSPSYPVVYYWLAYLYSNSSVEKSNLCLRKAEELSPFLVFPHRLETIPVLTWAVEQDQSWKSKYYLGLIYWHILRTDKAAELFEQCGDIPDFAPFYIARGTLFRNIQSEYCHPCNDFSAAVSMDPGEWRTWHYLINFLQSNGAFQKELENSEKAFAKFPANPVIGTDHSKALLNTGKYVECIKVLEKVRILPMEGAHEGHDIFEQANLSLAVQMTEKGKYREALKYLENSENWPENLGAGKPFEPDTRFQDFISAYCYEKLEKQKSADECYARIKSFSAKENGQNEDPLNLFIANRILIDNGKKAEADRAMEKWKMEQDSLYNWNISSGSSSPRAQWVIARYYHEDEKAALLEKEIASVPSENRFRLFLKTYNNFKRIIK